MQFFNQWNLFKNVFLLSCIQEFLRNIWLSKKEFEKYSSVLEALKFDSGNLLKRVSKILEYSCTFFFQRFLLFNINF